MHSDLSPIWGAASSEPVILMSFDKFGCITDIIKCTRFHNYRSRGSHFENCMFHVEVKSSLTLCTALTRFHVISLRIERWFCYSHSPHFIKQ
jgi:hypothetical protein